MFCRASFHGFSSGQYKITLLNKQNDRIQECNITILICEHIAITDNNNLSQAIGIESTCVINASERQILKAYWSYGHHTWT